VAKNSGFRYDKRAVIPDPTSRPREGTQSMKLASNTGMLLLGIWLVLTGLTPFLNLNIQALPTLMNVLAVAAGAMILMNK
jgi:uncharacterized membrane-anchored protein